MRKWIFCLIFGLLFNAFSNDEPVLEIKTTVTTTAKATNAYVAFLVRGQGLLISDAQKACDANITAVSEKIKERFKTAQIDTTTVNTGTKDFQGWRAPGPQIEPDVTQLVTVTLPPDETLAAEILDIAIRKGAIPFCSDRPELLGAVYYGIDNTEAAEEQLYQEAAAKLRKEAERLANLMKRKVIQLKNIRRFPERNNSSTAEYREIRCFLPAAFCSSDPNKVRISMDFAAIFEISE